MKKSIVVFIGFFVAFSTNSYAQQNSPVAGNSAILIDLLKKDYNTVDPDSRPDELIRDRAQVISIFKSYLTDAMQAHLATAIPTDANLRIDASDSYLKYINTKKMFDAATQSGDQHDDADDLATTKSKYVKDQYTFDDAVLKDLKTEYHPENNFIESMIDLFIAKYSAIQTKGLDANSAAVQTSSVQKSILSPGTDLSFTTYADAFAKFLAKRIKEELVSYVMEQVKITLQNPRADDPFAEFKILLPTTTNYLVNFNPNQILNFQKELRQYIQDDLDHLLDHAPDLANTPRFKQLVRKYPEMQFVFEALSIIPQLQKIKYPDDYFSILESSPLISAWKDDPDQTKHNMANLIRMAGLIAHSLQVIDNDEPHFAGRQFFTNYGSEINFYKLFFGFLYQQNKKYYDINYIIAFPYNISLTMPGVAAVNTPSFNYHLQSGLKTLVNIATDDQLQKDKNQFMTIYGRITKDAEQLEQISQNIKQANKLGQKIGADTVHAYIASVADIAEQTISSGDTLVSLFLNRATILSSHIATVVVATGPSMPDYTYVFTMYGGGPNSSSTLGLLAKCKPYISVIRSLNDMVFEVRKGNYADGLVTGIKLYETLVPKNELSEVVVKIDQLSHIQQDSKMQTWKTFLDIMSKINANQTLDVKKDFVAASAILQGEVYGILGYYHDNFTDVTLDPGLNSIITALTYVHAHGNIIITAADYANIKALIIDPRFKMLVVSFYTNLAVEPLIAKLSLLMTQVTIPSNTSGNPPISVFNAAQVGMITGLVQNYAVDLFADYIVNGKADVTTLTQKFKVDLMTQLSSYLSTLPHTNGALADNVIKLISFINDVAQAKDADGIEQAIDAFALPTGSSSIKRTEKFNIAINSYPGILPAIEFSGSKKAAPSIGFTAPVGISFAWGSSKQNANGIFVSIVDIGAITRLRLDNDKNSETLPEVTFKNVFSPGIYYSHGFRNSPISVNIGLQYGPELRDIQSDLTYKTYDSFRVGAGIVLDIPLFNFYTKSVN